jgi:hypothetical protein
MYAVGVHYFSKKNDYISKKSDYISSKSDYISSKSDYISKFTLSELFCFKFLYINHQ